MDNRKLYWLLVIIGSVAAIGAILVQRLGDPALHDKARIVAWVGIAVLLIARLFLRPKRTSQDVKDLFPPKKQG